MESDMIAREQSHHPAIHAIAPIFIDLLHLRDQSTTRKTQLILHTIIWYASPDSHHRPTHVLVYGLRNGGLFTDGRLFRHWTCIVSAFGRPATFDVHVDSANEPNPASRYYFDCLHPVAIGTSTPAYTTGSAGGNLLVLASQVTITTQVDVTCRTV